METVSRQRFFEHVPEASPDFAGWGSLTASRRDFSRAPASVFDRLEAAKRGFCLRRVDLRIATLLDRQRTPEVGSLFLARVTQVGQHARIELPGGRRSRLYVDDEVLACYGHRYAPDQYGIRVPEHMQRCALATSGGVAGDVESQHEAMGRPTMLQPIAMLGDLSGAPLNLSRFALPTVEHHAVGVPVFAVLGTSMNSGKTTMAANVIRGLNRAGLRVAAAKVTGTGSGADYWQMLDAGAAVVRDFSDCGLPSTFRASIDTLRRVFFSLLADLERHAPDAIVIEISDGLFQRETAAMLSAPWFAQNVNRALLAAPDAMALTSCVGIVREHGLRIAGTGGLISRSPLAMSEAIDRLGVRVLTQRELQDPEIVAPLLFSEHE